MIRPLINDTLLRALRCEVTDYTPVWLMRQAGRYMPEYQKIRKSSGSFLTLAKTPALAAEVTLQPIQRFPSLDAAILFSDILTIPDAMGLGLSFSEGEGPEFAYPLRKEDDILRLTVPNMDLLQYVFDAVKEATLALTFCGKQKVPLIGFSGSPFTLACYMVEGKSKTDFLEIRRLLYTKPDLLHHILSINAETITSYLNKQISSGVNALMIFDTWGGLLGKDNFEEFSLRYIKIIIDRLNLGNGKSRVPVILFTKGGGQYLSESLTVGADALGIDWTVDPMKARSVINGRAAIQGNLDPAVLLSNAEVISHQVSTLLSAFGSDPGHVFNLGHGVLQTTPVENVDFLIKEVKRISTEKRIKKSLT